MSTGAMPELFNYNRSEMDLSLLQDLIITSIYSPFLGGEKKKKVTLALFPQIKTFN